MLGDSCSVVVVEFSVECINYSNIYAIFYYPVIQKFNIAIFIILKLKSIIWCFKKNNF